MSHLSLWDRVIVKLSYQRFLGGIARRLQRKDDFEWRDYTRHYVEPHPDYTQLIAAAGFTVAGSTIQLRPGALPLHQNHRLIYETALRLGVRSAFEFGFGGGYHLANLRALLPDATLGGADISEQQLQFALKTNGACLKDPRNPVRLEIRDLTDPNCVEGLADSAELVYCQAVLMHIHGGDRPAQFLRNMSRVSRRFVLLVENWHRHDYVHLLHEVMPGAKLFLVRYETNVAVLLDKENALTLPLVESDSQLRALSP